MSLLKVSIKNNKEISKGGISIYANESRDDGIKATGIFASGVNCLWWPRRGATRHLLSLLLSLPVVNLLLLFCLHHHFPFFLCV